jgi:hypothetical protein
VTNQGSMKKLISEPFRDGKKEKEGYESENADDWHLALASACVLEWDIRYLTIWFAVF